MTNENIDVDHETWSKNTQKLRSSAGLVKDISDAVSATMSGNVYGIFTPIFYPMYALVRGEFPETNEKVGTLMTTMADAIEDVGKQLEQVDKDIANLFTQVSAEV